MKVWIMYCLVVLNFIGAAYFLYKNPKDLGWVASLSVGIFLFLAMKEKKDLSD